MSIKNPFKYGQMIGVDKPMAVGFDAGVTAANIEWVRVIEEFKFSDGKLQMDWLAWQQVKRSMGVSQ